MQKYERYDLSDFKVSNNFHVEVNTDKESNPSVSNFELRPDGDNTVHISGNMKSTTSDQYIWKYENCAKDTAISWNLTSMLQGLKFCVFKIILY